jgi:TPR repeat protein/V8-like Glu-specific endopeptidase
MNLILLFMKIKYNSIQQGMAYMLLVSLLSQSCSLSHPIKPAEQEEMYELDKGEYITGRFEYFEEIDDKQDKEKEEKEKLVLSAPPYRPQVMLEQSAQIYDGQLQSSPYDRREQEKVLNSVKPGQDGRTRINNTTDWPYPFHSQLDITYAGGKNYGGSGILVGPQHILTAGHNIYDYEDKTGWAQRIIARLALNDKLAPYGESRANRIYTFKGWTHQGNKAYDMALLVLDKPIGYNIGWCGLLSSTSQDLQTHKVHITGYPGDKGFKQMWSMSGYLKGVHAEELEYKIDTFGEQSGSGIWLNKWGYPYVVGIHTLGGGDRNSGVRLSYVKLKQVIEWIKQTSKLKELIPIEPTPIRPIPKDEPRPSFSKEVIDDLVMQARNGDFNALKKLLEGSHVNHPYVQFRLGKMYEEGGGVTQNLKQAFALYEQSSQQGNIEAQFRLGCMYYHGYGIAKDFNNAFKWYQEAANQELVEAQNNLGYMYQNGLGVRKDDANAIKWYRRAANRGFAAAQYNLGYIYQNGCGIEKDDIKAFKWYQKAAEQGVPGAQYRLGCMYQNSYGVRKDHVKALEWYQKAAEQGLKEAQYRLGCMYQNGYEVRKDDAKALEWYQKAAEQGLPEAQYRLGCMYQNGYEVEIDDAKAVEWYQKAASRGFAVAQYSLGYMYQNGYGVERDHAKALEWYQKAARRGLPEAQNNIGYMYQNGYGVKRDYAKALEWYQKAARRGLLEAQNNIGYMYQNGYGVERDYAQAIEWYQKAASRGFAAAKYNLGYMYQNGYGVERDHGQALEWYQKAAEQGLKEAQNKLEYMYQNGYGVKKR